MDYTVFVFRTYRKLYIDIAQMGDLILLEALSIGELHKKPLTQKLKQTERKRFIAHNNNKAANKKEYTYN